jgi:uracil-DNA glycosylase family 4
MTMQTIRVAKGCTRCPALVVNRRCIVHGYGPPEATVVLVGEAPGYKGGDLTGVPFTLDRSGVRLQQLLIELGLSAETNPRTEQPHLRCFVTNVVRCNPPANRTPTRAEIANCKPYLRQELALLQPRILVPLGNVAAQALFSECLGQPAPPISRAHAQAFTGNGRLILPMRHPARCSNADLQQFASALRLLLQAPRRA